MTKGHRMKKILAVIATLFLGFAMLVGGASSASAGGSDSPTPYTVSTEGIQLPNGAIFADNGHVNVNSNQGNKGIHFESLNWPAEHPKKFYIGKSFIPWSAFGYDPTTLCVTWVQIDGYNEHFGEGGQSSVGNGCAPAVPEFETYEVCAWWKVVEGNDLWPQDLLSRECGFVPPQECKPYKIQFDKYWIKDEGDKTYWEGLTRLESAADDARLDPHDYRVEVIPAKDCAPPKPETQIQYGDWSGDYTCDDVEVTETRTVTTIDFVLVDGNWVPGEPVTTTETQTRPITEDELQDLGCNETPPTEEPPTEEPPVTEEPPAVETPVTEPPAQVQDTPEVCTDFSRWYDAQLAFLAGNSALDADGDGVACESLKTDDDNDNTNVVSKKNAKELAETGFNTLLIGYLAAGLLLTGAGILVIRRLASK